MHIPSVFFTYTFLHAVSLGTNATPTIGSPSTAIAKYCIANITNVGRSSYWDICIEEYWLDQALFSQQLDNLHNQFSRAQHGHSR